MANGRFLWITALQRPFPIGQDTQGRHMLSCNFIAQAAAPIDGWEELVAKVLQDAGAGTQGTSIFTGGAVLPSTDGPLTSIVDTGGTGPARAHTGEEYENLSLQLIVRGKNYAATRSRALASWRALDGIFNTTVTT